MARLHAGSAVRRTLAGLIASVCLPIAHAAEPVWLKLQAPRFGVVSQLEEDDTRKWAVEFDQFVDALHQWYSINEAALPPLTIVLFEDARAFAPYRNRTESGQADVAGFFGGTETWSVIGLAGRVRSSDTRRTIYHEAVHWFMSADDVQSPLWFEEGLAEVYSTFEVKDGQGWWGQLIQQNVDYLNFAGLEPLEEFLRHSQDEALHGSTRYYPQAWAFVHYLLFGNRGAGRTDLQELLAEMRKTDLDSAFAAAFGKSYDEVTSELRGYLRSGRYSVGASDLRDRSGEMTVEPASAANVEFSLARLAVAGGNDDLARRHIDAVIALAPTAAPPFELRAVLAQRANDAAASREAIDAAIERGSEDPNVLTTKAFDLIDTHRRADASVEEMLAPEIAREAADLLLRCIALRPRSDNAYEGLALALLNVDVVTEQDDRALALGRRARPTDGLVLLGQAALERQRGSAPEALRLLRDARSEPFAVPARYRSLIGALHDAWLVDWVNMRIGELVAAQRFDEAKALVVEQLADSAIAGRARTALESMQGELLGFERLNAAAAAARAGKGDEAESILREVAADPDTGPAARREAQRLLDPAAE